ncbi:MAG: ATP-binding protein [Patescibacteria group bacterium]|nr:ATP-binding protein [Patescibacteria group bacterium]
MIQRSIAKKVLELSQKYPVISITGPRQSGKTSICKKLFAKYLYVNLENLDTLARAKSDPKSFLKIGSGSKMVIDEIQRFPDLLSYIQVEVDEQKIDGQFVITGSQNLAISENISQSLAGRVANFTLLPLSIPEIEQSQYRHKFLDLNTSILRGFYPRPLVKKINAQDFYRDYLATYVERDVRQIKNIGDLSQFQKFLQLVAGRVGQLVNFSSLANDVGVSYKTIKSWLSVLEASYIIYTLQPYFKNFGKRAIKSPKLYFYDVGLLCHLLEINSTTDLMTHYAYGQIFENLVITEVQKNYQNTRKNVRTYFWRDNHQNEIDLLLSSGGKLHGVEIKSSQTFNQDMIKGLRYWRDLEPATNHLSTLVYSGLEDQKIQETQLSNWRVFISEFEK